MTEKKVEFDKNDNTVVLTFSDGHHARYFVGWFLNGADDELAECAEMHMRDGDSGFLTISLGGVC